MFYILCFTGIVLSVIGLSAIIKAVVCRFYSFGCENCVIKTVIVLENAQSDAQMELMCAIKRHSWLFPKRNTKVVLNCELDENSKIECINLCRNFGYDCICDKKTG